jgi:hypothetical protein
MMIKAVTQSITTFRTMSQSGALFADGIEGMRTAATGAGMTLEDFSKVTTTNKEVFAKLGLGVSAGMQRLSGAMKVGGEDMSKQLFALGYSMEDQGNMMAQTMANMSDPTGKLKASDEQVAAATKKYAQDLSLLSALTGEDIKSKQEKIKQENLELAVQQKLAKMTPEDRQKFIAMQASMNDTQRRQLKERMIYGTVISADLAIMESTSSGMKKQGDAFFSSLKDGTMSAEKGAQLQAQYGQQIAGDFLAAGEMGVAAAYDSSGQMAKTAKGMSEMIGDGNKYTKEGIEKTKKDLAEREKQAKEDPMVAVQERQLAFGLKMQSLTDTNMKLFGEALDSTMDIAERAIGDFSKFVKGATDNPGWTATVLGAISALSGAMPAIGMLLTYILNKKGGDGGGGIDMPDGPDGDGKKGTKGKPKSRIGKVFNAAKNIGSKALGFLPGFGTAATAAAPAATAAASTAAGAAGATSLIGKGAGMALKAAKFLGPAAMIGSAAYDGFQGYKNAGANFDLAEGQEASAGQKASSTAGGVLSGLTFGLLDQKKAAQGVHSVGSSVGNFFSKAASGVGNVVSGGANLIGGGISALAGKAGLGSGYSPMGGADPKVFLDAQKANNDKLVGTMKEFGEAVKSSNKSSADMTDLLKTQLAKQDEFISILKEHLSVSQSLLTTAQG